MFPTPPFLDSKPEASDYERLRFESDTSGHDQNASSSQFPTKNNNSHFLDKEELKHQTMHTSLPSRTGNGLSRPSIVERSATANSLLTDDGEDVVYQPQNDHPFLAGDAATPGRGGGQRDPPGVVEFAPPTRKGQPSNPIMGPAGTAFGDGMFSRHRTNISNAEPPGLFAGGDSRIGFPSMRSQDEFFQPRVPFRAAAVAAAAMARNQAQHQNASLKMLSAAVSAKKRWALQEQDAAMQRRKRARMEALMRYGGLVEARPGKFVRMVGTERARKAIARGKAKVVKCQVCENAFQVHRRARVLYCKGCQHFSPLVPELEALSNKKSGSVSH